MDQSILKAAKRALPSSLFSPPPAPHTRCCALAVMTSHTALLLCMLIVTLSAASTWALPGDERFMPAQRNQASAPLYVPIPGSFTRFPHPSHTNFPFHALSRMFAFISRPTPLDEISLIFNRLLRARYLHPTSLTRLSKMNLDQGTSIAEQTRPQVLLGSRRGDREQQKVFAPPLSLL